MMRMTSVFWLCCLGILLAACAGVDARSYQIHVLSAIAGCDYNCATDINDSGIVVGYNGVYLSSTAKYCKWDSQGVHDTTGGGYRSIQPRINNSGQIVGGSYMWPNGFPGSSVRLPSLYGDNSTTNALSGINGNGDVCGGSIVDSQGYGHACLWYGNQPHDLGKLTGSVASIAVAVNNQRQVACRSIDSFSSTKAFVWQGNQTTELPRVGGYDYSDAYAINESGVIAGCCQCWLAGQQNELACLWQGNAITQLTYPGFSTKAYDVNNQGVAVGGYYQSDPANYTPYTACVWENGQLTALPGLGFSTCAYGINDAGWIVGRAATGSNTNAAVVWEPLPEPSCVAILASSLVCLGFSRWRRRYGI